MKKQIKKQGTQNIISFTKEELDLYGWKVGSILDLSDAHPTNHEVKKEVEKGYGAFY